MQENSIYAFIALLIPVMVGRFLVHQSLEKMDAEKKAELLASVDGMQKLRFISIFVIIGAIYFLPKAIYIILPLFIVGITLFYWTKISKIKPPQHYTMAFFSSLVLGLIGIAAFLYFQQGLHL